ncbi:AraC family transcriptional regulator [Prevotella sp. 10(H)]|uniref:AraC family transcriptional regulator n=1 Tax=Prevotella sp. 10(H) TaxID=1158294 RepID=UPI0004A742E7|nr:AraC family transcriptional regulator [Prevotella sp. 10(H)]
MDSVLREVTPLSERDCFMIFSRIKKEFTFPIHIHKEFELNFIENAAGTKRVVGDSIEEIDDLELTLITGENLRHGWFNHNCKSQEIKEITIQFHNNLFNEHLLQKNQFQSVKELFEKAKCGVTFSKEAIQEIKPRLYDLSSKYKGAHSVLKLLGILCDLSLDSLSRVLSSQSFNDNSHNYNSRRIEKAYSYILDNYDKEIRLSDVADLIGMTEVAFSRFLKQRTGRTFIDSLNNIRLGHATRMLVDTTHNVAEIALLCGFNNLSNFNRIFKKKKHCTPKEFRENYKESRFFL